jgi:hypothetical protein
MMILWIPLENVMEDITHALPELIAAYIAAHNRADTDAFIATFSADALLNDVQREFVGHDAIRAWAAREIFGDRVTMQVRQAFRNHRDIVVHARIDGDFDKSKLPDPLILSYYFAIDANKITQLIILRNKSVWQQ